MSVEYSTTFDYTENPISDGGNWTAVNGIPMLANGSNINGSSNSGGTGGYNCSRTTVALADDQRAKLTLTGLTANSMGPLVRCFGSSGINGYYAEAGGTADKIDLYDWAANTPTLIGTWSKGSDLNNGDTVEIQAEGTTIRVLYNDVEVISVTDATHSSGDAGVFKYQSGSAIQGTDFECGNVDGGGGGHGPLLSDQRNRLVA